MRKLVRFVTWLVVLGVSEVVPAWAATGSEVFLRVKTDIQHGAPIVIHLIVALCDNENQGIVPVPRALGNGQDPSTNLYWGARYGVATYFPHDGGWTRLSVDRPHAARVLARSVYYKRISSSGRSAATYVVAEAWNGAAMGPAIERFLRFAGGNDPETLVVQTDGKLLRLVTGGASHLVAFIGHNGLMDASLESVPRQAQTRLPSASMVLACMSKAYFADMLERSGSHPALLTTGLMAPEAYTLDAALHAWVSSDSDGPVCEAAAAAYDRYQHCGLAAARALFWGAKP